MSSIIPRPALSLDHLIVAASDLKTGISWVENLLRVPLEPGGQHLKMGTHNALLRLGKDIYLEVIAIDPSLPAPRRPRWFGLDVPEIRARLDKGPEMLHWVVRTVNIETAVQRLSYSPGPVISMSRSSLSWRITVPEDGSLPGAGLYPSLIQWQTAHHPASTLPDRNCSLIELILGGPEPDAIEKNLQATNMRSCLSIRKTQAPTLSARIKTPCGERLLG